MTLKVFGRELDLVLTRQQDTCQVLCSLEVLKKLVDAYDILEPVWLDGQVGWISDLDFEDLDSARLGYDVYMLNLTVEPIGKDA